MNADVIASPQDALNVFDFEGAARQKLPPAHFGYIATGVDDDVSFAPIGPGSPGTRSVPGAWSTSPVSTRRSA